MEAPFTILYIDSINVNKQEEYLSVVFNVFFHDTQHFFERQKCFMKYSVDFAKFNPMVLTAHESNAIDLPMQRDEPPKEQDALKYKESLLSGALSLNKIMEQ